MLDMTCAEEDCGRPVARRGFCNAHYQRRMKAGTLDRLPVVNGGTCKIEGCQRGAVIRGLCGMHNARVVRKGDPGSAGQYRRSPTGVPRSSRDLALWKTYRLSLDDFASILARQDGKCALCRSEDPGWEWGWCVDHDHSCCSGKRTCGHCIRGLVCLQCNVYLGYVEKYRSDPNPVNSYLGAEPCSI